MLAAAASTRHRRSIGLFRLSESSSGRAGRTGKMMYMMHYIMLSTGFTLEK